MRLSARSALLVTALTAALTACGGSGPVADAPAPEPTLPNGVPFKAYPDTCALLTPEERERFLGPPPYFERSETTGKGGTPIPVPTSCFFAAQQEGDDRSLLLSVEIFPAGRDVRGALDEVSVTRGARVVPDLGDVAYASQQGTDSVVEVLRGQTLLRVSWSSTNDYTDIPPEDAATAEEIARIAQDAAVIATEDAAS